MDNSAGTSKLLASVMRNLGWLLASRGLNAVLSLGYLAIITRTLGVSGFGQFALLTGTAQIISGGLAFECWQIIVQYGTGYIAKKDDHRLSRLFRLAAVLDAASAVMGIILAWAILHFFADQLGIGRTLSNTTLLFNIILLVSIRSTPLGILRLRDRFSLAAIADSVTPVARLIGAIAAALFHPTLQAFLIAWGIAELLTAATFWLLLRQTGDFALLLRRSGPVSLAVADNPGIVRFALTTNANATMTVLARQLPLLLVGTLAGTAAAGTFRLASQLSHAMTKLSQLIARAAFPDLVRIIDSTQLATFLAVLKRAAMIGLIAAVIVFTLIAIFGGEALRLIGGPDFGDGYSTLLWLAAAGCIDLLTAGFEALMTAARRVLQTLGFRLASTIVLALVAYLLQPVLGVDAVAAGVTAYSFVLAVLLVVGVARVFRENRIKSADARTTARSPVQSPGTAAVNLAHHDGIDP